MQNIFLQGQPYSFTTTENPAIGIILCKEKDRTIVEYSLRDTDKPINVAAYKTMTKLPKEFKNELPSVGQIALLLEHIS